MDDVQIDLDPQRFGAVTFVPKRPSLATISALSPVVDLPHPPTGFIPHTYC